MSGETANNKYILNDLLIRPLNTIAIIINDIKIYFISIPKTTILPISVTFKVDLKM